MLVKTPNDTLKTLWIKMPKNIKVTFLSAFFIGLVAHLFMLTNTLPTHDEVKIMTGNVSWASAGNGRWLSDFVVMITGMFSLPWVNGVLTIVFISISSCLVVSVTKVKGYVFCILISAVMVTLPVIAGLFSFMQMAPPYFLSLLLACFATFIAHRYKYGFIFAAIPIVMSLAIYQAFFGVTAALFIVILILDILREQTTWQKSIFKGIRFIGTLGVGMILYLVSVRILYPDGLTTYQALDRMGQVPLYDLPNRVFTAYFQIARFFLVDGRNFHFSFMNIVFVLAFVACGVLLVLWCIRKKLYIEPVRLVLLGALLLLLPLACNLIFVMGPALVHDLMIYGTVFIFVFVLAIADLYFSDDYSTVRDWADTKLKKALFLKIASISVWIITLAMSLTVYNYWILSNQAYFKLNIAYQTTYAQSTLLFSRIQNLDGFEYDMDIVIVGSPHIPQGIPELEQITISGVVGPELFGDWTYPFFPLHFMNITQNVVHYRVSDIRYWNAEFPDIVREMPIYPDYGSIKIIDNVIYVRFAYID